MINRNKIILGSLGIGLGVLNTAIELCIVVFSMVIAFLVFRNLDKETFIKPDDTPVTAAQIAEAPSEDYTGRQQVMIFHGCPVSRISKI